MPHQPVITISCPKGLRTTGDTIAGTLNLNLALAEEKDVTEVTLCLRCEVKTQVTVRTQSGNNTNSIIYRSNDRIIDDKQLIWTPESQLPAHSSGAASFPFSFTIPTMELPPSYYAGNSEAGGSVQYYLHAVGVRKSWYKANIRVDEVFPFLPTDLTPAPSYPLPNWPGQWQSFKGSEKMRRGIFSSHGLVEAEFYMPSMPSIPLFKPIPIRLRIICTSKPHSSSAANDIEKFDFPRNPKAADCDLTLCRLSNVSAGGYHRKCTDDLGLQAGFGLPDEKSMRATWGQQIQTSTVSPHWVVDESDKEKGRWSEEIVFSSTLVFRCPTPFSSPHMASVLYLDLSIDFPGIGNKIKTEIGPLPLTSGIGPRPPSVPPPEHTYGQVQKEIYSMPQPHLEEIDLPPSYYEVMHMDEKSEGAD